MNFRQVSHDSIKAVKALKNRKIPEEDKIKKELFKYGESKLITKITKFFQLISTTNGKQASLCLIQKRGEKEFCEIYRNNTVKRCYESRYQYLQKHHRQHLETNDKII